MAFQAFLPDGSEYEFEEGDSVVFAAKRNKADLEPAVRIEADVKEKVIRFQRKIQSIWNWEGISGTVFE